MGPRSPLRANRRSSVTARPTRWDRAAPVTGGGARGLEESGVDRRLPRPPGRIGCLPRRTGVHWAAMPGDAQGQDDLVPAGPPGPAPRPGSSGTPPRSTGTGSGYGVGRLRARRRCSCTAGDCGPTPTRAPIQAMARGRLPGGRPGPPRVRRDPRAAAEASGPSPGYGAWVGRFLDAVGAGGRRPGGRPLVRRRGVDRLRPPPARAGRGRCCWPTPSAARPGRCFPNEVRTMVQRPFWDWGRHFGDRPAPLARGCSACSRRCSRTSSPTS